MKKFKIFIFLISMLVGLQAFTLSDSSIAEKKGKGLSEEEMTALQDDVNMLLKKVYASSLFSPGDANKLVDAMAKVDELMTSTKKDPTLPRLFFNVAFICKDREYTDEAVGYFKMINEKFPESPYAAKSLNELKKMGVKLDSQETSDQPAENEQ